MINEMDDSLVIFKCTFRLKFYFKGAPPDLDKISNYLGYLKHAMDIENLQGKQENQLRERHHWAVENLRACQQDRKSVV